MTQITKTNTKQRRPTRPQARPDQIVYTIKEVRQVGGPGRTKTYELIRLGILKSAKVHGRRGVDGDSLRALLKDGAPTNG